MCKVATEPPECLGWNSGIRTLGCQVPPCVPGRAQPGNPAGRTGPAPSRQRKWRGLYIRPRLAELGADRQGWGGVCGKNARAKSLDHVGRPGGPQERHPRSEAMNASGEGDSFSGSVQSKCRADAASAGSAQRAGPGIWDPGDGAPCMPSPPAPREAGLGAELL